MAASKKLRSAMTPTSAGLYRALKRNDPRAAGKAAAMIQRLQAHPPTGKVAITSVGQLKRSGDARFRGLGNLLSTEGLSEKSMVAIDEVDGPGQTTPPSFVFVIFQDFDGSSGYDRAVLFLGLLLRGEKLLPLSPEE